MVLVPVLLTLGVLGGAAFTSKVANHIGYGLPRERGLPYRIHYNGRDYRSHLTCAGAQWCEDEKTPEERVKPYCTPRAGLGLSEGAGDARLMKVDDVFILFGSSRPLFTVGIVPPEETATRVVVEASDDCYLTYDLVGGP
ncbi:hypothetical protein [Amycolatopsis keratiniphila]|uniref:hypothetical protein n=1 Tax=Amycolatopsis keratiniphila TaxID=129921 RepID=UPI00087D719F|nr:hypothetical protein [Amycolatopsis keratiniphila]OLZ47291.1 hypothetical protein BS330_34835 [Amycolatopsis keratiniphila subsp. nogabecina]SDU38806.1 hypothetical protein SAMN04489733_3654 [Amycolatopsis keratiniphila]